MPASEICNRKVVVVRSGDTAFDAAKLMRQHHVGDVVVVEDGDDMQIPVGIVTDRDLVVEIMATGLNCEAILMCDLMVQELAWVKESTGVFEAIQYMRAKGVRRLPVVNDEGGLIGILALDDLLELLSEELLELARLVKCEQKNEAMNRC